MHSSDVRPFGCSFVVLYFDPTRPFFPLPPAPISLPWLPLPPPLFVCLLSGATNVVLTTTKMQGMNFVCRSLLQVYPKEEEAFWVFVGMLQRFGMRKLYCPGMPLLRLRCVRIETGKHDKSWSLVSACTLLTTVLFFCGIHFFFDKPVSLRIRQRIEIRFFF